MSRVERLAEKIEIVCKFAKEQGVELLREPVNFNECNRLKKFLQGVGFVEDSVLWTEEKIAKCGEYLVNKGIIARNTEKIESMAKEIKEYFEDMNSEWDDCKYRVTTEKHSGCYEISVTYEDFYKTYESHEIWLGEYMALYRNHKSLQKHDKEITLNGNIKNLILNMGYLY